jgi:hypothetical protein
MGCRLHLRGLQFCFLLLSVAGVTGEDGDDEDDYARDYERDYEQGFEDDSENKHERALEVIEIIAKLENVTLASMYGSVAAFAAANATALLTVALAVCEMPPRTQTLFRALSLRACLCRCAARFARCLSPPHKVLSFPG